METVFCMDPPLLFTTLVIVKNVVFVTLLQLVYKLVHMHGYIKKQSQL